MLQIALKKHALSRKALPLAAAAIGIKLALMHYGVQPFEMNTLISSMIAANVFLLGFLINGAMPDFKEAERLPGEMAASLDAIGDELLTMRAGKNLPEATEGLARLSAVADGIHDWFHRRTKSGPLMERISALSPVFASLEPHTQANFIVRLKQEQTSLRRQVTRAHSIRETTFAQTAYVIAETFTGLLLVTLLLTKYPTMLSAAWFTGLVGFLLIYMLSLIYDLDNPFNYEHGEHAGDEIPLRPLEVVQEKLRGARAA